MNTDLIYWIDVSSKIDQMVTIGIILCFLILLIFCLFYLMTKGDNTEKTDERLYNINKYLSGIQFSMNNIKDRVHSISYILDPKSIFKNINEKKGGEFVNVEISGEMTNLSDKDKENLLYIIDSVKVSIDDIENYKKHIEPHIKNLKVIISNTEFLIKGIRILSVLLIILSLIHIFIPSREAMQSIANTSYTVNYDAKGE